MSKTTNLQLFKHDEPLETNENDFDIDEALNDNWDILDTFAGQVDTRLETLENDLDEISTNLDTLETSIETIQSNVTSLQTDNETNKQNIQDLQTEQETQNTAIENNTEELELLKNNLPDPITTEQSEEITVQDAMNYYSELDVSGNSTQEQTEQGANLWWDNDTMHFSNENRQNLTTQTIKAGTYKFSCDVSNLVLGTNTSLTLFADNIYYDGETDGNFSWLDNITANGRISKEVVIPKDISTLRLKLSATQATNGGSMTISNLCLRTDDSDVYVEYVPDSPSSDYSSKIKNCGDNINELKLDDVEETTNAHGITYSVEDGVITLNGTSIRAHYINFNSSKFDLPAGDYTMSGKELAGSCSGISGKQLNNDDNSKNLFKGGAMTSTVTNTIGNDETGVHLALYIGSTAVFNNYKIKIKLEKGSIATPYSPYNCGSVDIKVENEDEEKIITFPLKEGQRLHLKDYFADDGVHHVKQTCVFDGTENIIIAYNDETIDSFRIAINSKYNQMLGYQIDDKCSHFKNLGHTPAWGRQANTFALSSEGYLYIFFEKNKITSETEAKNWITEQYNNGTPLTAEGTLEEEHIEPYTEEQQTVYNELQRLILYKGYNYITCIDETKCKMKLTYRPDNNSKIKSLEERVAALENSEVTA